MGKILYSNTVILNPKLTLSFKPIKPQKLVVTNKEILISTKPVTKIPISTIYKINMNPILHAALRIHLKNGKKYKLIWAPTSIFVPYNILETQALCDDLNRIIYKH
ncbi:hypothetical protein FJZ18_02190 [Candidatus Pacearchaeota archaeon]|nr:hypothetical protein [Candidatus Pacearchaeota archaeon]